MVAFTYDNAAVGTIYYSREIPSLFKGLRLSKIMGRQGSIAFESNGLFVFVHGKRRSFEVPGLLRVDAAGGVLDCVSLTGGDAPGKATLEAWLRRVSFQPGPAGTTRWIALGLGFTNQPADGSDPR